ncbi:helix-turn-helix domain-containing protein [Chenggangzhangella methanolivorans]|uniref:Helix-turn-helix transcriptional regulator n=1 Tax=Chenggangzhangella methanolivorans TaxID=1437009 RepID=A0A9E6RD58_9HYPH|nr:helix-turn-helix transcriptional regulator [Chenggangzhangella methanolivorans]QZO02157.1 helix-turn-helix transcriptional regulator [Chenggangzhangella methanolivorans]
MVNERQIKAARSLLDWSQQELAERAGIARFTLIKIETGEARAQEATISKIVAALENEGIVFFETEGRYGVSNKR